MIDEPDFGHARIVSTNTKILQISGLRDKDLNKWEQGFVDNIMRDTNDAKDCSRLSDPRLDTIERIWKKHFA